MACNNVHKNIPFELYYNRQSESNEKKEDNKYSIEDLKNENEFLNEKVYPLIFQVSKKTKEKQNKQFEKKHITRKKLDAGTKIMLRLHSCKIRL